MPFEALALAPVLSRLIGLGVSAWTAHEKQGLGAEDARAIQSLIEAGASVAGLRRGDGAQRIAALHFVLVTRAFGEALKRHWCGDEHFIPGHGWWERLKRDDFSKARGAQIEERMRIASPRLLDVGDRPADEDLGVLSALLGDPRSTPYYRRLWGAFTDPGLDKPGEEPLIMPDQRLSFERHFRLAYAEGLASPRGEDLRRYLLSLGDERTHLVRELMTRDMATWGNRHVFGNVAEHADLPPMPLGAMYVEPGAGNEQITVEPVLDLLERMIELHPVLVVQADFGHGKSLTARTLAWRKARAYLADGKPSPELWRPVFVKCAEDFESHGDELEKVLRRAQWRLSRSLQLDLALDDRAFGLLDHDERTLCLIDGLDEVALGDREVKSFFRRMVESASTRRRFVVFTRPAVLRHGEHLRGVPVLDLQPLDAQQIEAWLTRWSCFSDRAPALTENDLKSRGLLDIAKTPILLFMIAHTWDAHTVNKPALGDVYEGFFKQIARGKYERDSDTNKPIAEASERLRDGVVRSQHLPRNTDPSEAMLWLMSRVAWKMKCLEDAEWLEGHKDALEERHVRDILRRELRLVDDAGVERTIQMGLLLALQANLEEGTPRILFGHKSFREFLVGRYWASRLRRLVQEDDRTWEVKAGEPLLEGRLLGHEDEGFAFLREQIAHWRDPERRGLVRWAQRCFDDESIMNGAESLRADRRPLLREAALAVGSAFAAEGLSAADGRKLRTLLAWFWAQDSPAIVRAPKLLSPQACLSGADLRGADLRGADLSGADLRAANLSGADLRGADLRRADLRGAALRATNLIDAKLAEGSLRGAILHGAYLRLADLSGTDLSGADLSRADLRVAELRSADLTGADLRGATYNPRQLEGALLDDTTRR